MIKYLRMLIVSIALPMLFLPACSYHVFNDPMSISTKAASTKNFQPIRPVMITKCWYTILIPLPSDARVMYDRLLDEAKKSGGNAVIDVEVHGTEGGFFWFLPPFGRACYEAKGIAARFD